MRNVYILGAACAVFFSGLNLHAELKTSTEFGETVTADELIGNIFELQNFWPGVRKFMVSKSFQTADLEIRRQAADLLAKVDASLTKRLNHDSEAEDLLNFLAARVRKYRLMRKIRKAVGDDAGFWVMFDHWERSRRLINHAPSEKQAEMADVLLADVQRKMKAGGMSSADVERAMDFWRRLGRNRDRMSGTAAGQLIIGFENQARKGDARTKRLLQAVVRAADWALVTKAENQTVTVNAFRKAWAQCSAHAKRNPATQTR